MPLLDAANLTVAYDQRVVLRDVSLRLDAGEVVALLGPNGSGKSTLLRTLLGQLALRAGDVRWDGRPLKQWSRRELARFVAYLPQSAMYDPSQTVADVLRLGRAPYWGAFGLESSQDLAVVRRVAQTLDLVELLPRSIDQLSGGQRQRVFVGRALVQEPKALLLDEPNTFLDLRHQVELSALLRRLAKDAGVAVLMASHDLNLAAMFADRLILLESGAVAAAGSADEVLKPELLTRVYGVPIDRVVPTDGGSPVVLPRVAANPVE